MELINNEKCGYRFLTGIPPFSSGVVAMPGYEVIHANFMRSIPLAEGFERVAAHLASAGLEKTALCAMELRSPEAFSVQGFDEFNAGYIDTLRDWGILLPDHNPVARTNVAPIVGGPSEPGVYAFSYVMPSNRTEPTFIVAGAGEVARQSSGTQFIVREDETTPDAMAEKAAQVLSVMKARLNGLGQDWSCVSLLHIYTSQCLEPYLRSTILENIGEAAIHGVSWHLSNPPIKGLEFEMDMRGVRQEIILS